MSGPSYIHWPNCGGRIADHGDSWCEKCGEPISGNEGIDIGYWQREPEIAELEAENERLKVCGNCGNHNGYKQDCSLDRSPCYERSHCHFTPSRWAERETA